MKLYLLPPIEDDDLAKHNAHLAGLSDEMSRDGLEPFAPIAYETTDKDGKPVVGTMVLARRKPQQGYRWANLAASPVVVPVVVVGALVAAGCGGVLFTGLAVLMAFALRGVA